MNIHTSQRPGRGQTILIDDPNGTETWKHAQQLIPGFTRSQLEGEALPLEEVVGGQR